MSKAEKNLELRGGVWYLRASVRGKRVHVALATDKVEAKRKRNQVLAELRNRPRDVPTDETVRQFSARWRDEYVAQRRNAKGLKMAKTRLEEHILPVLGHLKLAAVQVGELRRLRAHLEAKELSPLTVRHVLSDVRCLLTYARDVRLLLAVPSFKSIMPKQPEEAPRRLTDEQVAKILEILPPQHGFTAKLALLTGLRYGELHRLQWRHVNWKPTPHLVIETTKSGKVRRVPLSSEAVELLRAQFARKRSFFVVESRARGADNIYKRSRERCGFRWHFHQLRHTFASRFIEAGGSLAALQRILGHSTVMLTQRYAALSDDAIFREAARVNLGTGTRAGTNAERAQTKRAEGQ